VPFQIASDYERVGSGGDYEVLARRNVVALGISASRPPHITGAAIECLNETDSVRVVCRTTSHDRSVWCDAHGARSRGVFGGHIREAHPVSLAVGTIAGDE